jgi:hypothetical protein
MSSIFTHAYTSASIGLISRVTLPARSKLFWLFWLVLVGIAPDFDYLISTLRSNAHQGLRITHSLLGVMLLPCLTLCILWWQRKLGMINNTL